MIAMASARRIVGRNITPKIAGTNRIALIQIRAAPSKETMSTGMWGRTSCDGACRSFVGASLYPSRRPDRPAFMSVPANPTPTRPWRESPSESSIPELVCHLRWRRNAEFVGNLPQHSQQQRHFLLRQEVDLQVEVVPLLRLPRHPICEINTNVAHQYALE